MLRCSDPNILFLNVFLCGGAKHFDPRGANEKTQKSKCKALPFIPIQSPAANVGIRDLYHTVASWMVSGCVSLDGIGRLLGHTRIGPPTAVPTLSTRPYVPVSKPWARC